MMRLFKRLFTRRRTKPIPHFERLLLTQTLTLTKKR